MTVFQLNWDISVENYGEAKFGNQVSRVILNYLEIMRIKALLQKGSELIRQGLVFDDLYLISHFQRDFFHRGYTEVKRVPAQSGDAGDMLNTGS